MTPRDVAPSVPGRRSQAILRILLAHGLAYPLATAWAFAAVPAFVVSVASGGDFTLDDATVAHVAHAVLVRVAWVAGGVFVVAHVAGAIWAFHADEPRGRRVFLVTMVALFAVAVVLGGGSWIWLMTR